MNRNLTIRLLLGSLVIAAGLIVFSYTHAWASRLNDPAANSEGQCESGKCQTPFVLWESLTHNVLIGNH